MAWTMDATWDYCNQPAVEDYSTWFVYKHSNSTTTAEFNDIKFTFKACHTNVPIKLESGKYLDNDGTKSDTCPINYAGYPGTVTVQAKLTKTTSGGVETEIKSVYAHTGKNGLNPHGYGATNEALNWAPAYGAMDGGVPASEPYFKYWKDMDASLLDYAQDTPYIEFTNTNVTLNNGDTLKIYVRFNYVYDEYTNTNGFARACCILARPTKYITDPTNPTIVPIAPTTYNVTLTKGTGISSVDGAGTYTSGSSVKISAKPSTGYHFTSWSNGVTSNPYTFTISRNVSLTAYGAANTNTAYRVEHYIQNINSDTYALVNTDNLTGTTGASITPSVKSYTGFTSPATTTTTIAADGSTVVKYYYIRNSYNVALEKNTGISSAIGGGSKEYGASVTINAKSANGYNFLEWTTSSSGVNNSTSNPHMFTMPANAVTYAANATPIEYVIEYNLNGGEVAIANPNSYTIESPDIILNEPTKIGYTFIGWTDSNDSPPQTTVTIAKGSTGNKSYTANWKLDFYAYIKQSDGSWKQAEAYIRQDGTWKKCEIYVKDNDEWKKSIDKDL